MTGIRRVVQEETLYACIRFTMTDYSQVLHRLEQVKSEVPESAVTGPPVLIRHYVSSVKKGTLVELGLPVNRICRTDIVLTRTINRVECLSLNSACSLEKLSSSYGTLFHYADEKGIISDEYGIEILHETGNIASCTIEARLVIHPWENLFRRNLVETLGEKEANRIFKSWESLPGCSDRHERFQEVKEAVTNLEKTTDDFTRYLCLSGCAHVFPQEQIKKLRTVFLRSIQDGGSKLDAVDAVISFMDQDPGWVEGARRKGNIIYTAKGPRDEQAYMKAVTPEEKAAAACFCPIIRNSLNEGMPRSYCYCGAGWYRQQWEGATGLSVKVEILSSLLSGDEECRFAVHLPLETD